MGKSKKLSAEQSCDSRGSGRPKSTQSTGLITRRPTSVTSLASQYNLVTGRYTANVSSSETLTDLKSGLQVVQYGNCLYDTVLVYLTCPVHRKVALSSVENKGQFLPFAPIKSGESWLTSAANLIQRILGLEHRVTEKSMFTDPTLVDILRLQMPIYFEFITRVSYQATLTAEACKAKLCQDNSMIAWFSIAELQTKVHNSEQFAGPEPVLFAAFEANRQKSREITILDVLLYKIIGGAGNVSALITTQGELLRNCGYTEADILRIYGDYLQHCCPSEYMTFHSFKSFINQVELPLSAAGNNSNIFSVFRAFSFNQNPYINFYEFLLGFAMIDRMNGTMTPEQSTTNSTIAAATKSVDSSVSSASSSSSSPSVCPASGNVGAGSMDEFAAKYVFRYYAKTDFAYLTENEFDHLIADHRLPAKSKKSLMAKQKRVTMKAFLKYAAAVHIGNRKKQSTPMVTYSIFASCTVSPLAHLRIRQCYPPINWTRIARNPDRTNAIKAKLARARDLCANCRARRYTLSSYLVKMNIDGLIYEPVLNKQADVERMSRVKRILSERYFTRNYVCNQLVDMIRKYAIKLRMYSAKIKIDAPDWEQAAQRLRCVEKIVNICNEARAMFAKRGRVIKVSSPCYVIGDIHGNLNDLLIYEKVLWKLGPYFNASNFLFLGDYVDRGDYSVECIIYLLCMKLLAPDRIYMLRGNHESRALQAEFTFQTEVATKFGSEAVRIFEAFNDVFDAMPLCALLDESIYTAHGGIPSCAMKIEQIMSIQCPLKDPDNESNIAMEILWNDPVTNQEYADLLKNNEDVATSSANVQKGFLTNTKRGTGCYYSEDALKTFMDGNSLTHIIRAHEVIPAGYQYHMGGRCLTVFSCSHYCGGINEAAVAFVHDAKIRVIKVDTTTASEA